MRALIYARVSTADKEQDPGPQLEEMREHCRRRGWPVALEETDRVSSGKDRPGLQRILTAARARRGDVVLCRHFDRIARTTLELLTLLEELRTVGVDVISLNQQIDTTTPSGKLMFTIIAAFAEFERSMIRERVKLGLEDARKQLAANGRTRKGKTRFAGRPRCDADAARIAQLSQAGASVASIAKELRVSRMTVYRLLKGLEVSQKPLPAAARNPLKTRPRKIGRQA